MKEGTLKKCPKCGKSFSCLGEKDCWCEQYRIHKKEMVLIMQNFKDCLCPECLKGYERE